MTAVTSFARELSRFLGTYMPSERGASSHTIASYRDAFSLFLRYMRDEVGMVAEDVELDDMSADVVTGFLGWVEEVRGCSASTRNVRLAAIRSFAGFLQYEQPQMMEQWQRILSIRAKKVPGPSVSYAKTDGIRLILAQPDVTTRSGRRDLAMLAVMYDVGARVSEVCSLTPRSVRLDNPPTLTVVGKGRKARVVPLSSDCARMLGTYMDETGLHDPARNGAPLFSNRGGGRLTRAGVSYILGKHVRAARSVDPAAVPEGFSCHSMRHSRAMGLLEADVNLVYIRDMLGHSSVQTTEIYARADGRRKREAIESAYRRVSNGLEPIWLENGDLLKWLESLGR